MTKIITLDHRNHAPHKHQKGTKTAARRQRIADRAPRQLYFAYGMNTCVDSMADRCPTAISAGSTKLDDHKMVFRGVADVIPAKGRVVHGALWWITASDERSLDLLEGFPRLYTKRYGALDFEGRTHTVMFYAMVNATPLAPPYAGYENMLRAGYRDFGLPHAQIDAAIAEAPPRTARFSHTWLADPVGDFSLPRDDMTYELDFFRSLATDD